MNGKNVLFSMLIILAMHSTLYSQKDTTRMLSDVTVEASRVSSFSSGIKISTVDSISFLHFKNKSLAELLSSESPISIKSYGQGSLATTSFRGGSASQTAIIWNGFNINSITNGQLDISLVPVNFANNISIQYGGVGALWGSGAIGGAIHLGSIPAYNSGFAFDYSLFGGSFHSIGQNISLSYGNSKISSSIAYINNYSDNDFEFTNLVTSENNTNKRASSRSIGLANNNHILISKNQQLSIALWFQDNDRNIPPTLLEQHNSASQHDYSQRYSADWRIATRKIITHIRGAYFNESLHFTDSLSALDATSLSQIVITEIESKWNVTNKHWLNFGINNSYSTAKTNGYSWSPERNSTALFASFQYENNSKRFSASTSIRQELISNMYSPLTYSAGAMYAISKMIVIKSNVSRLYRLPTFNDLYWTPGGNPSLVPEDGYSEEIGLMFNCSSKHNKIQISEEVTFFNRTINDWIIWLPTASYWTPQNLLSVWSRGVETQTKISYSIRKIKFQLSFMTNYVLSTNEEAKSENDNSIGKQLIYVPIYSANGRFSVNYLNYTLAYRHQYTGYRYTATDHSQFLEPYQLGSLRFDYRKEMKNYQISSFFSIDNLWNLSYQIMPYRPMPMRNFQIGLTMKYKSKI